MQQNRINNLFVSLIIFIFAKAIYCFLNRNGHYGNFFMSEFNKNRRRHADIATAAHMSAFLNTQPKISIRDIQQKKKDASGRRRLSYILNKRLSLFNVPV